MVTSAYYLPAGLPALTFPGVPLSALQPLLADAAGIALIAFTSLMLTSRSFAAKNGYEIDADRDLAALGAANIAASISGGFAVSGADSRTAMSDAAGGRTQVVVLHDGERIEGVPGQANFRRIRFAEHGIPVNVPEPGAGRTVPERKPSRELIGSTSLVDVAELQRRGLM